MSPRPSGATAARQDPTRVSHTPVDRAGAPTRTAALWVPDWPVLAVMSAREIPAHVPAATHDGRRVVAVSAVARARGVRRGMRRRVAREACPELVLLDADDALAARDFEPVARAAETVVAGLEILRPGLVLIPAAGAARYHGSEDHLAAELIAAVAECAGQECQVGVGDGILAAVLAARESRIVADAETYLAGQPTRVLAHVADGVGGAVADLVNLLARLGVHTLGDLVQLPADLVESRFGALGAWAHRLARGQDLRPPARRRIEPDIAVGIALDPPALRADTAAFAARRLAEELCDALIARSVIAGRLRITARTQDGADLERTWRAGPEVLTAARITDRVRWQLDGWLTAATLARDDVPAVAPLIHLAITAEEVVPAGAHQPRLWGASSGRDARAHRALGRVQGLLGGSAVLIPHLQGGRDASDPVRLVPFGEEIVTGRDPALPWPGALPAPRPALVSDEPVEVAVLDMAGHPVVVDARRTISADPASVRVLVRAAAEPRGAGPASVARVLDGRPRIVRDWAGPWPLDERWWGPDPRRRAYLQVLLDDGVALLLATSSEAWTVEGIYD